MKAYHVKSVNCNGTMNYITFSREKAMKEQCVFVKVDEIEVRDFLNVLDDKLDITLNNSVLARQAKEFFGQNSAREMIGDLKHDIKNLF